MKNTTPSLKVLGLLALLCAALVLTACPRGVRPPHPHRLPRPVLPMDALLQMERQQNAILLSTLSVAAARIEKS